MNRLNLISIFSQTVEIYLSKNELDFNDFKNIVDNCNDEYDENKVSYLEAKLVCNLFSRLPYYRVIPTLDTLTKQLVKMCGSKDNYNYYSVLLKNGLLAEMLPNIKRRVETENYRHILESLREYTQKQCLSQKHIEKVYSENILDPNILTGSQIADNINYQQINLFGEAEVSDLKEAISRNNANYKETVTRALSNYLHKEYTPELFSLFVDELLLQIDNSSLDFKQDILKNIEEAIPSLFDMVTKLSMAKKDDEYQLTLSNLK